MDRLTAVGECNLLVCDTGLGVVLTGKVKGLSTCTLPSSRTPSGICVRIGGPPVSIGCNRAVGRLTCLAPTTDVVRSPILRRRNSTRDSAAVSDSLSVSESSGASGADAPARTAPVTSSAGELLSSRTCSPSASSKRASTDESCDVNEASWLVHREWWD